MLPSICPALPAKTRNTRPRHILWLLLSLGWISLVHGMTDDVVSQLRADTRDLFYHGYDNYMTHAFPEDELKPLSCKPQTRNRENPADIGLNDVLGNYSLTLIDSLSTLAILASDNRSRKNSRTPLLDFQNGVKSLVDLYGDGNKTRPCGSRACGFDLDSKVQVFETNIRGVGGLLSAHLFATGKLPIRGYDPVWRSNKRGDGIKWKNGLVYNRQLLDLAYDLARRLLPAFDTPTGIPYPRVNLRYGIPFYKHADGGMCRSDGSSTDQRDITENCAAGAGSLMLEFSTLSRLTGDDRFEKLAKRAFWAIWDRRSQINLVANGIDAESGQWTIPALSGIGAGIDSFFEYSLKTHILLSNLPSDTSSATEDGSESFLHVWQDAHTAVRHHVLRSQVDKHPYYGQVDFVTGASRYAWVDNLSAYYPGLLVLAGEVDEAIESHLLYSALWTRYGALPERWQVANAYIDPNFKHWAGRPEFIESTFYLYQATKDPFYLHVGEMALRDIRRRCWTKCGWADLGDVTTGEQRDRMESFFLGETAKYLYLLFDESHPLNKVDRPVVFTTEGHPLLVPRQLPEPVHRAATKTTTLTPAADLTAQPGTCPVPPAPIPFAGSQIVSRPDFFHAAALAGLHLVSIDPVRASELREDSPTGPSISYADLRSPTNYTFYPWTLPQDLVPAKGYSSAIYMPVTSTLTFPDLSGGTAPGADRGAIPIGALQKVLEGIVVSSLSNIRLNMVQEPKSVFVADDEGAFIEVNTGISEYRINAIANWALGRDEKVLLTDEALKAVSPNDPNFTKMKDLEMLDLVLDVPIIQTPSTGINTSMQTEEAVAHDIESMLSQLWSAVGASSLASIVTKLPASISPSAISGRKDAAPKVNRIYITAILPTGIGAAPLPVSFDIEANAVAPGRLPLRKIIYLDDDLCSTVLPLQLIRSHNVLIVNRGGCSFSEKLVNIPAYPPTSEALQLVIVVNNPEYHDYTASAESYTARDPESLIRPLLDVPQLTPNGFERRNPIAMVMVDGTADVMQALRGACSGVFVLDKNGELVEKESRAAGTIMGSGMGIKRRYWFESMGVRISNLLIL